jgi:outer membrane protein assembly factor BamD
MFRPFYSSFLSRRSLRSCALVGAMMLLAGCASEDGLAKYQHLSAGQIYQAGQSYMAHEDYNEAATAFQALNANYPFSQYSEEANLQLIYAEYQAQEPALVLAEADRYLKLYPTSPHAAYAHYMIGVVNFDNGRGFIQRHMPYHMSDHDAPSYTTAYQQFNVVVTQYPQSRYAPDARRRMIYLMNTLAEYQYKTAEFYYVRHAYIAAIHRATTVLTDYPHSTSVLPSMKLLIQSYQALHLETLAQDMQRVYTLNDGHQP